MKKTCKGSFLMMVMTGLIPASVLRLRLQQAVARALAILLIKAFSPVRIRAQSCGARDRRSPCPPIPRIDLGLTKYLPDRP